MAKFGRTGRVESIVLATFHDASQHGVSFLQSNKLTMAVFVVLVSVRMFLKNNKFLMTAQLYMYMDFNFPTHSPVCIA